jgi:hypothetical protein
LKTAIDIIEALNVPKELALGFLGVFSRFEYALKRAGYVKDKRTHVSPDWVTFGKDLAALDPAALTSVSASCPYLLANPPKKQVLRLGALDWEALPKEKSQIEDILASIRTVRNNLFHGGKFPTGPVEEPLRDKQLITECLAALQTLLQLPLPKDVAGHFRSGI